ncbi:hypothetical protein DPEC_G00167130 [Dallia pectoralis]|uniref:Uncharacterized protein n=1 Tax=Dallia pectoralis TaxID=75939 RepID=A0ACC2GHT6_DALPE|nr:hypothetical protein DPEC_G00167130 [Dallia pectoralis]
MLCSRTTLGCVHNVDAIYPLQTKFTSDQKSEIQYSRITSLEQHPGRMPQAEPWDPPVDLSHLTDDRQQQVRQMLREESDVFAKDDGDTGCIKDLQMDI